MKKASFDFETCLIEPGKLAPPAVCLTWQIEGGHPTGAHARLEHETTEAMLRQLFTGYDLFGARTAFDAAVAMANYSELTSLIFEAYAEGRVHDVQLVEVLHQIEKGKIDNQGVSLNSLTVNYLGVDRSAEKKGDDIWRLRYGELIDTPWNQWPDEAKQYALDDAQLTLEVAKAQKPHSNGPAQARAGLSLHLMSCWGVHTDPKKISEYEVEIEQEYQELTELLIKEGMVRKNGTRNIKFSKQRMLDHCLANNLPLRLTKKGVKDLKKYELPPGEYSQAHFAYVSLDRVACEESGSDVFEAYADRVSVYNIKNTEIPNLKKGVDLPIQANFVPLQVTGRTSCNKGRGGATIGFQLQNPRKKGMIRECFEARPGHLFALTDLDAFEMCCMGQIATWMFGFSKIGDAINSGKDTHSLVGCQLLSCSYEEFVDRRKRGDAAVKNARNCAKVANFGFLSDMAPHTFVQYARSGYGMKFSISEAETFKAAFMATWDEMPMYFAEIKRCLDRIDNQADMIQFISERVRGKCSYTAAANTLFQGLAADAAKSALFEVTRACYDPAMRSVLYNARPWNFVHDEIITEVEEDLAHEQAFEQSRLMLQTINTTYLPDVNTGSTPALATHWYKDAEAVYDENGRLMAWDIARDRRIGFNADGTVYKWQ